SWEPVLQVRLHSAGDASPLTALLLPNIFPIRHPTVHKTHGGDPAQRSSRRSAGAPTARTVRRGVDHRGASPPSVRRRTCTTGCQAAVIAGKPLQNAAGFLTVLKPTRPN